MFKIFPASLINNQKIPLISGWKEKASNDPEQIRLWQELFRERISFWGIPTGEANGIFALDVDTKKQNGWETLKNSNLIVPETLQQATPSGGAHFIFKYDPTRNTGNKVGFLPGLDLRSEGGWIACYNFDSKPISAAPEWIYEHANKKQESVPQQQSLIKLAPEIAEAIFKACIDNIISAAPGESNNVLNIEAFKAGQLVASGSISKEFAESELLRAAKERGKPDYEARATIESGLKGGGKNPLTSPFGNTEPIANFTIPAPPENPERWTPRQLTRQDLLNTSKLRKPQLFEDWSTEDISITTADGGTGKTTLKLYEAVCLALGDRFLGFENKQRGKTLFITGEDTAGKLAAMLGAVVRQMGLLVPSPENEAKVDTVLKSIVIKKDADLCLISKDRQGFLHPNPAAMKKVLEAVDDIGPKMIVFDPIASFWGSEAALNDMNKAVTKFMSELVDRSNANVEMINHMGKSSSANKDMSQFAGRGGSGLPSNSRVSRVLRALSAEEYEEFTGTQLQGDKSPMLCNVNKFTDGSPLFNKPFIIVRDGYLFTKLTLSAVKTREIEKQQDDGERIFAWVKEQRHANKYPTRKHVVGYFMNNGNPMSEARIKRAVDMLEFTGRMGERFKSIPNPDLTIKDQALIIIDVETEKEV